VGKTLCCLAIVLANKAPRMGPGDTAPGEALPASACEGLGIQEEEDGGAEKDVSCDGEDDVIEDEEEEAGEEVEQGEGEKEGEAGEVEGEGKGAVEGEGEGEPMQQDNQQQRDQQQQAAADAGDAAGPSSAGAAANDSSAPGPSAAPAPAAAAGAAAAPAPAAAAGKGASRTLAAADRLLYSRATLVVCAVSLVGQWADEAARRTDGSLRILQYHGSGRYRYSADKLARDYDGECRRVEEGGRGSSQGWWWCCRVNVVPV